MAASSLITFIAIVALLPVLGVGLVQLALRAVGWSLESQGQERRAAILAKVSKDRAAIAKDQVEQPDTEDDWEKVEKAGEAENGQPLQDDWHGIVGFFHPFW